MSKNCKDKIYHEMNGSKAEKAAHQFLSLNHDKMLSGMVVGKTHEEYVDVNVSFPQSVCEDGLYCHTPFFADYVEPHVLFAEIRDAAQIKPSWRHAASTVRESIKYHSISLPFQQHIENSMVKPYLVKVPINLSSLNSITKLENTFKVLFMVIRFYK